MKNLRTFLFLSAASLCFVAFFPACESDFADYEEPASDFEEAPDSFAMEMGNGNGQGKGKGPKCGPNRCAKGEVCCNESCGICTPPGGFCTQQICEPAGEPCGDVTCGEGLVCCNASCGICTEPGGFCIQIVCN